RRTLLPGAAKKCTVPRLIGLPCVKQARIDNRLVHLLRQAFEFTESGEQYPRLGPAMNVDSASIGRLKCFGPGQCRFEIFGQIWVVWAFVQIAQVPLHTVCTAGLLLGHYHAFPNDESNRGSRPAPGLRKEAVESSGLRPNNPALRHPRPKSFLSISAIGP